ncbi:MAG TPA: response regulator [Blastocatellia bacterium]|nr:response regulator [Blastocatellia bacterium]
MMSGKAPKQIRSGIEPVDKLLGGLEIGQLYLVHGDASGKSLFGIKFLIEGLKRGESGALVIRYSPEDAVRRFARLGYDCLEDVYSGRLVILEYSNEIIQQIARLRALSPVLRELEWLLGETKPQRLVFDPVTNLVVGEGNLETRVQEFATWASSFGATVALIANGENEEVIRNFGNLVCESFRFEVQEIDDRATRFLVFEKTPDLPEQPIEVDPSRGVFLLARARTREPRTITADSAQQPARADSVGPDLHVVSSPAGSSSIFARAVPASETEATTLEDMEPLADFWSSRENVTELLQGTPDAPQSGATPENEGAQTAVPDSNVGVGDAHRSNHNSVRTPGTIPEREPVGNQPSDLLSDLLDDLAGAPSPLDLDALDMDYFELDVARQRAESMPLSATGNEVSTETQPSAEDSLDLGIEAESIPDTSKDRVDLKGGTVVDDAAKATGEHDFSPGQDSNLVARAVEILLRPPETTAWAGTTGQSASRSRPAARAGNLLQVNPKEFNVLVIDDDVGSSESSAQALSEYNVETVRDGISGLAKLISFRPDLVVLNVDLPIIDGFKILAHIRSSLNMPIIIVSGSRIRASDRLLSTELGADYYLTKPFSVKELKHKARQLIARHRGISSWIVTSGRNELRLPVASSDAPRAERRGARPGAASASSASKGDYFIAYSDFVARVEKGARAAIDNGMSFSVVGCRVSQMTAGGGQTAIRLLELVRALVRESDVISTNPHNDIVALLADADAAGARAFVGRLREHVSRELNQEPNLWMRSFPDLEEKVEPVRATNAADNPSRRASDRHEQPQTAASRAGAPSQSGPTTERSDPRASYIDFLERKA